MKRSEEVNLSQQIAQIEAFSKRHHDIESFYQSIGSLALNSIQDLSFEKDVTFFEELSFVLSVILSIIAKPHLNNKSDEIIARSGEVSSVSQEDFQKTLRDASIWRDRGHGNVLPEYLYYHQYQDEIKIYENIFIVHLINEISLIADHYSSLYISLLSVASENVDKLILDNSSQLKAMDAVNYVSRRIDQIKNTYFYKEVSKAKNKPKVFSPTNILLKDRLYNICFKFYKQMYVYEEKKEMNDSLFIYYFVILLKKLHDQDYELDTRSKANLYENGHISIPEKLIFTTSDIRINLDIDPELYQITLTYKDKLDDATSSHRLYIETDSTFRDSIIHEEEENIFSTDYLSLWHLGSLEKGEIKLVNRTLKTESEMMETFINSHHFVVTGSEKVYSSYCPSCKNKNLVELNGYYRCPDCGAIYKFMKGKGEKATNKIVFAKLNNYGRK